MNPEVRYYDERGVLLDFQPAENPPAVDRTAIVDMELGVNLCTFHTAKNGALPARPTLEEITDENAPNWAAIGDTQVAAQVASHAIHRTRFLMHRGPLNQLLPREDELNPPGESGQLDHPTVRPGYMCEPLAPAYLDSIGDTLEAKLIQDWRGKLFGEFARLLAPFYRGVRLQCGVCSTFSAVATGMMSMDAPVEHEYKNTERNLETSDGAYLSIINLSHAEDHSFSLVSYGNSPWLVCDPWVAEPYVLPLEENWCKADGITAWSELRVYRRLEHHFGLPVMSAWNANHLADESAVTGLHLTPAVLRLADRYIGGVFPAAGTSMYPEAGDGVAAFSTARPWHIDTDAYRHHATNESLAIRKIAPKFHVTKVFDIITNHDRFFADGAGWAEFRRRNPPVVRGNEWGDRVSENANFVTQHNDNVDFDTNTDSSIHAQ